jgi:hypothetical protein
MNHVCAAKKRLEIIAHCTQIQTLRTNGFMAVIPPKLKRLMARNYLQCTIAFSERANSLSELIFGRPFTCSPSNAIKRALSADVRNHKAANDTHTFAALVSSPSAGLFICSLAQLRLISERSVIPVF